jgi:hypothetical protein
MTKVQLELEKARKKLLDLGLRNKLISYSLDGVRSLRIIDELSNQVFSRLVKEKADFMFRGVDNENGFLFSTDEDIIEGLAQPEDETNGKLPNRHTDNYLQTKINNKSLQTQLLRIESEARIAIEEQGLNILYLALGFIKWFESESSSIARYAPLILIPVRLHRASATSKYKLSWTEEDIIDNESLIVKFKTEFGIQIPRLPPDSDDIEPSIYFKEVEKYINKYNNWEIEDSIALGFFTFAKLLMWKDLDIKNWESNKNIANHKIVKAILEANPIFEQSPYFDDSDIDEICKKRM